jgi:hypothetical protein
MPVSNLCFDMLLLYFASKARVRNYFTRRIYPRLFFWRGRNQVGSLSIHHSTAWGPLHHITSVVENMKLSQSKGKSCQSSVLEFSVIADPGEEFPEVISLKQQTRTETAVVRLEPGPQQEPVLIRVQSLPS